MITRDVLIERQCEVSHLIKWWVSRSDLRYARVREFGELGDFANDVWAKLLFDFRIPGHVVEATLSTVVTTCCKWTSVSFHRIGDSNSRQRRYAFRCRLRDGGHVRSWHRTVTDDHVIDHTENRLRDEQIARSLRSLTWREASIIRAHFGLLGETPMTYEQIGKALKISRERVRQIEARGLRKLQKYDRANALIGFTDTDHLTLKRIEKLNKTEYGKVLLDELMKPNGISANSEFDET